MKFFSDIFSNVIKDQLNSAGVTYEIQNEVGEIELDSDINDLLDEFGDL